MPICVICRLEKSKFNIEHVIPRSINGYYLIKSVCDDCNSKLGSMVDSKLINYPLIKMQRKLLNIKGHSGKTPNFFENTFMLTNHPKQKFRVEKNEYGEFDTRLIPQPQIIEDENNPHVLTLIDEKDLYRKDEIIDKFLKRNNLKRSETRLEKISEFNSQEVITEELVFDESKEWIGLLKIAYEFAVDTIPQYFNDELAIKISKILHTGNTELMAKELKFGMNLLGEIIFKILSKFINFEHSNHYLLLFQHEQDGLICFIKLFNSNIFGVILSDYTNYLTSEAILGINDSIKKTFEKLTYEELVEKN